MNVLSGVYFGQGKIACPCRCARYHQRRFTPIIIAPGFRGYSMKRCLFVLATALAVCFAGTHTGLTKEKPAKAPTIEFHGQSMFILTTSKGKRVGFDPHFLTSYQRAGDPPRVDIVCLSH